jgi:Rieske Fe-S protein
VPETGRRGFLYGVLGTIGTVIAAWYVFLAERFMLPPPESASTWQKVGTSAEFQLNQPRLVVYTGDAGFPDGVYVVRLATGLRAFDVHCVHLQCTVQWTPGTTPPPGTFDCPCHGSVYTLENKVIAGPAPHGLHLHRVRESGGYVYVGGIIS